MTDTVDGTDDEGGGKAGGLGGRRFVLILYGALVGVSAVMGALFTVAVDDPSRPALFFLFELPATATGFALYGGVTIAVVLGLPLLLVVGVSEYVDDVDSVGRADPPESNGAGGDDGRAEESDAQSSEPPKD